MSVQSNASNDHDHDEDTTGDRNDDNADWHLSGHVIDGYRDNLIIWISIIERDKKITSM